MPLSREEQHALVIEHLELSRAEGRRVARYFKLWHFSEDLQQDASLGALVALRSYEPEQGQAGAVVRVSARHAAGDAARMYRSTVHTGSTIDYVTETVEGDDVLEHVTADELDPEESLHQARKRQAVRDILKALTASLGTRPVQLFVAHYVQEVPIEALRAHHGLSKSRCWKEIGSAREAFISQLQAAGYAPAAPPRTGNQKLSDADVEQVRMLAATGMSNAAIARHFGVNPSQVSRIVRGLSRGKI